MCKFRVRGAMCLSNKKLVMTLSGVVPVRRSEQFVFTTVYRREVSGTALHDLWGQAERDLEHDINIHGRSVAQSRLELPRLHVLQNRALLRGGKILEQGSHFQLAFFGDYSGELNAHLRSRARRHGFHRLELTQRNGCTDVQSLRSAWICLALGEPDDPVGCVFGEILDRNHHGVHVSAAEPSLDVRGDGAGSRV